METTLAQKAVSLALNAQWDEARKANLAILKSNPSDTDALNRLARANLELGKFQNAKAASKKVLALDPSNAIALKCLQKLSSAKGSKKGGSATVSSDSFLEESGKTRLITLVNTGSIETLFALDPGEEVKIVSLPHKVSILAQDDKYIGRLPDDIAARVKNLLKLGNKYQALVKSVKDHEVTIFVREIEKGDRSDQTPSFPPEKMDYVSFTPPELVHQKPPIATGEILEEAEGV